MGQTGYFYVCSVAVLLLAGRFGNGSNWIKIRTLRGTFTSSLTVRQSHPSGPYQVSRNSHPIVLSEARRQPTQYPLGRVFHRRTVGHHVGDPDCCCHPMPLGWYGSAVRAARLQMTAAVWSREDDSEVFSFCRDRVNCQ